MKAEILFEDKDILVVYKPAGLATQTKNMAEKDLESELRTYLGGKAYLGMIHRLDQPVEGLLVFAKTQAAAKELNSQITSGKFHKKYYAIIFLSKDILQKREQQGDQEEKTKAVTLEDILAKDGKTNTSKVVSQKDPNGKRSKLSYQMKVVKEEFAMVEIELFTGRHHQIRVQMANAGMPLLGDLKYGTEESICKSKECGVSDIALCAHSLTFFHPMTKKEVTFSKFPQNKIFESCKLS